MASKVKTTSNNQYFSCITRETICTMAKEENKIPQLVLYMYHNITENIYIHAF